MNELGKANQGEMVIYQADDGAVKIQVRMHEESIWLSMDQMAALFDVDNSGISRHLKNIFESGELDQERVVANFATTAADGKRYNVAYYNLDAIISVGYRVTSLVATRFRIWATQKLREYLIKGFVMDDERLKNPPVEGSSVPDYFDEMLERIRDIRASERRMYLRVKEIFTMAADYEPNAEETSKFFSIMQNKLHFAATGETAAEIIKSRANHEQPNMGLTSWKADDIRKTDVTTAKNYLSEKEIDELNRIVVMWLDFAEDQAARRKQVFMKDWEQKLDDFLAFNDRNVLLHAGKISKQAAESHAKAEFDQFAKQRRAQKESVAEADHVKQLEAAVKRRSPKKAK